MYKLRSIFEELTENMKNFTKKIKILKENTTGNWSLLHFSQFTYSIRHYGSLCFNKIFKKLIVNKEE